MTVLLLKQRWVEKRSRYLNANRCGRYDIRKRMQDVAIAEWDSELVVAGDMYPWKMAGLEKKTIRPFHYLVYFTLLRFVED